VIGNLLLDAAYGTQLTAHSRQMAICQPGYRRGRERSAL